MINLPDSLSCPFDDIRFGDRVLVILRDGSTCEGFFRRFRCEEDGDWVFEMMAWPDSVFWMATATIDRVVKMEQE